MINDSFSTSGFADRLTQNADLFSENIALSGKHKLSYADLYHEVCLISSHLYHSGATGKKPIALLLDHSEDLIKAILGIHLTGCCYAPLDVSFPPARLEKAISNIAPSILITEKKYYDNAVSMSQDNTSVLLIDELLAPTEIQGAYDATRHTFNDTDNAYLLSTSGTTGEPKGIVHNHRSLVRSVNHYLKDLSVSADDKVGLILPCTYTPSVFCIFGAIASGATLCPFDLKNQSFKEIIDWIREQQITLLYSSPTLFRSLMKECSDPAQLSSIRSIQLAGEPLFRSDVLAYQERFSSTFKLYNGMGSSETSCLSRFFIDENTIVSGERVPIGLPYDDVDFLICDENGNAVADGEEGDLIVEGAFFTEGYWRRPDLTSEKFSACSETNKRRFITGDRALRQHDGSFVHLGRSDDQIKLRGQRVELAAIESTILLSELASNSAAVLIELDDKEPFIAAFFSPVSDIAPIREYLSSQLPPFMIPTRIVAMESLPLNTSGKTDRRSLKNFDFSSQDKAVDGSTALPVNVIEKRILKCFQEVLKNEEIHVNSDFFHEGGDSISGVQLAIAMENALSIPINVSALIEATTPRKLSHLVKDSLYVGKSATMVKFEMSSEHAEKQETLPLFCLPGLPGNALAFRALAAEMNLTRNVYAFVYLGQDGSGINFKTIEDFVATCMKEIDAVYPSGPIALTAYSIGGSIGYELVKRLKEAGREIALFTLIDCYAPNVVKRRHLKTLLTSTLKRLGNKRENVNQQQRETSDAALIKAVFDYKVKPQKIENMSLIVAKDHPMPFRFGLFDKYCQWQKLVKSGYQTVYVSGIHKDMLKKHKVPEIADIINAFLSDQATINGAEPAFSMKSLSDIWAFKGANSLAFSATNESDMNKGVFSLLKQPKQLTERLQEYLNDEVRTKLITSTQKGRYYTRKVALQTKTTNKTAVVAAIQIAMDMFDRNFTTEILQTDKPFGTILKSFSIDYSCEVVSIFKVDPDTSLFEEFDKSQFSCALPGRCSRFTNSKGQTLANVIEIIAPWV